MSIEPCNVMIRKRAQQSENLQLERNDGRSARDKVVFAVAPHSLDRVQLRRVLWNVDEPDVLVLQDGVEQIQHVLAFVNGRVVAEDKIAYTDAQ